MMGRTHLLCGISSLWVLTPVPPDLLSPDYGAMVIGAALGGLLPDLDAAESTLKHLRIGQLKPFWLPAQVVYTSGGHRGLLHSLLGSVMVALLCLPLVLWGDWSVVLALVLGYASHLAADAGTRSGIPLLYPSRKCYHLLPRPWRLVTGSQAEEVLFALAASSTVLLLLIHLSFR